MLDQLYAPWIPYQSGDRVRRILGFATEVGIGMDWAM